MCPGVRICVCARVHLCVLMTCLFRGRESGGEAGGRLVLDVAGKKTHDGVLMRGWRCRERSV